MYAVKDEQLKKLLGIVNTFSNDINIKLGLEKCARATSIKGKLTKQSNIVLNIKGFRPGRKLQISWNKRK